MSRRNYYTFATLLLVLSLLIPIVGLLNWAQHPTLAELAKYVTVWLTEVPQTLIGAIIAVLALFQANSVQHRKWFIWAWFAGLGANVLWVMFLLWLNPI